MQVGIDSLKAAERDPSIVHRPSFLTLSHTAHLARVADGMLKWKTHEDVLVEALKTKISVPVVDTHVDFDSCLQSMLEKVSEEAPEALEDAPSLVGGEESAAFDADVLDNVVS